MTNRKAPKIYDIFDNPSKLLIYLENGGWLSKTKHGCFIFNGKNTDIGTRIPRSFADFLINYSIVEMDSDNWETSESYYYFNRDAYRPNKPYESRNSAISTMKNMVWNIPFYENDLFIKQYIRYKKLKRILK